MSLKSVGYGHNTPTEINVVIEIPAHGAPIKYEVDKETGALFVDRLISTPMYYPCNYGYVPNTLSEDGDPVDVLVVTPFPLTPGCVIPSRPIGMLKMTDESGKDVKIVAVPANQITTLYHHVQKIDDLPPLLVAQIVHFFEHYKDLEQNKWVKLDGWQDTAAAFQEIMASINRYH
jgi:inorganic pyrophosphatase